MSRRDGSFASSLMLGMPPPDCILSAMFRMLGLDMRRSRPPLAIICWALSAMSAGAIAIAIAILSIARLIPGCSKATIMDSMMRMGFQIRGHSHRHHLGIPHHRRDVRHATTAGPTCTASHTSEHPRQRTQVGHPPSPRTSSGTTRAAHSGLTVRDRVGPLLGGPDLGGREGGLHVDVGGVEFEPGFVRFDGFGVVAEGELGVATSASQRVYFSL